PHAGAGPPAAPPDPEARGEDAAAVEEVAAPAEDWGVPLGAGEPQPVTTATTSASDAPARRRGRVGRVNP
ncbi:MAG TPA: hypothetical protein VH440_01915, partial [Candidatus Limnocylindrales bacterium]